jgi:tRNA-dihydrouridine synthase
MAQDEGAAAVAFHARTRSQGYSGEADWSLIRELVRKLEIPVLGNGDIWCGEDAVRMFRETGCASVMIGRAALGNPWIFREAKACLEGRDQAEPTLAEKVQMAREHLILLVDQRGERRAVPAMRKFMGWYLRGIPGARDVRGKLNRMDSLEAVLQELDGLARRLRG